MELFALIKREFVYISYYFMVQLRQIAFYWILGMMVGSLVSVFAKDAIHNCFERIRDKKWGVFGVIPASILGIASPLCMYGTIPIAASFSRHGMRHDWLAAFMMSSVLLNPQLLFYSTALGGTAMAVRLVSCTLCGIFAGLAVHFAYGKKPFFNFAGFEPRASHDTDPNLFMRFLKNLGRNVRATALYFLIGVLLSALFQRYVPADGFAELFGKSNEGFGVLMAATIGVPLYACGGGTIPLLQQWLVSGMSIHYNVYIPESYDGSKPYALYFTLPGYEGLYFQGVAANIESEEFGFEAQKYNDEMIIVAPQLNDWGETSADQTIALVEYFLQQYHIDTSKVYGNGYSGGGETMSIVMGKRPDLFTAYLHVSSQWDGEYEPVVDNRLPVYFAIGRNDEYYGSAKTQRAYDMLYDLYERQGLSKEEIDSLLVLDIKEHDYFTGRNAPNEHGGGGLFAYDEEIMGWLFSK